MHRTATFFGWHLRSRSGRGEVAAKYRAKKAVGPQKNREYAAMVEGLDTSVGTVLAKLEELGIADRTVVVFFSDNGGLSRGNTLTSNEPLRGEKSTAWEGGVRVPLIVTWPGVTRPGAVIEGPVTSIDLFPTMLGMAGLELGDNVDGQSLVSLLRGDADFERGPIYWHYPHYNAHTPVITCTPYGAVREGRFKLVELYEDDRVELYDLRADIGETRNLATAMPEKVSELRRKLHNWRESVGAQMPTSNPSADPTKYREYKEKRLWSPVGTLSWGLAAAPEQGTRAAGAPARDQKSQDRGHNQHYGESQQEARPPSVPPAARLHRSAATTGAGGASIW